MPIRDGIAQYALTSAFHDSRFAKITTGELDTLECGYVSPPRSCMQLQKHEI